jgi:hypothetical protein
MGISLLAELELVVVCPPVREESISLADAFNEDELNMLAPHGVSEATATVQEQPVLNGPVVVPQEPLEKLLEGLNIP